MTGKVTASIVATVALALLAFVAPAQDGNAQQAESAGEPAIPALSIGSLAPQIDVAHWLQIDDSRVKPVTQFEPGRVYVLEFWATTCGPCVRGMPHLSELQARYRDDVRMICISDEQPEVIEAFLDKPLAESKITFRQSVNHLTIATDPDRSVYQAYMDAAGEPGIPTSFVVGRGGVIEWIGHAEKIDGPLKAVIEGTWDRDTFAAEYAAAKEVRDAYYLGAIHEQYDEARRKLRQIRREAESQAIDDLVNKYLGILPIFEVNRAVFNDDPKAPSLIGDHFRDKDPQDAINWLSSKAAVVEGHGFSAPVLEAMIELAQTTVEKSPNSPMLYDSLAVLLATAGRHSEAIAAQEQAVQASEEITASLKRRLVRLREGPPPCVTQ